MSLGVLKVLGEHMKVMGTYVLKICECMPGKRLDPSALDALGPTPETPGKVQAHHRRESVWKAWEIVCRNLWKRG